MTCAETALSEGRRADSPHSLYTSSIEFRGRRGKPIQPDTASVADTVLGSINRSLSLGRVNPQGRQVWHMARKIHQWCIDCPILGVPP